MKIILKTRVPNLGQEWDIVTVKDGYAQNFLLPNKMAEVATPARVKMAEKRMEERLKKLEEVIANAKETAEKLAEITLNFKKKAKGEKLYGSVSEKDIIEALASSHKLELSKEMVKMKDHLKELGEHKVKLHLAEGVEPTIKVIIEAE
ncbi:MAG: 50S ribosomal protein L9 [Candidatus Peregrinibacteria bacterium]|nr:50S ribosomal protein L9 [Candidatus Peregrinibacteria bacterium]